MNVKKMRGITSEKESWRRFEERNRQREEYFDDSIRNRRNCQAEHHGMVFVAFLSTVSIQQSKHLPVQTIMWIQCPHMRRYARLLLR